MNKNYPAIFTLGHTHTHTHTHTQCTFVHKIKRISPYSSSWPWMTLRTTLRMTFNV